MKDLFSLIGEKKIIAILRGLTTKEETLETAFALSRGGIHFVEVAYDQTKPAAVTTEKIALLHRKCPMMHVGAGTVINLEQLEQAHEAGAEFIISPNTNPAIIKRTKELHMISQPGAMTPSEIITAYEAGADIVKIFPSGNLGLPYIKALRAPINHIPLAAVGGVSLANIRDFFKSGIYCVGIGANIADAAAIHSGNFEAIERNANAHVQRINEL